MTATLPKLLTAEEFGKLPNPADGSIDELVRGEVVIVGPCPTARHGLTCASLGCVLGEFVDASKLGHVLLRTGLVLRRNPDTVRGPDVSFFSYARLPVVRDDWAEVPPDMVAEVIDRHETPASVSARVREFVEFGVPLIWLVDPETNVVTVYSGNMRGVEHHEADTLDGGTVLPGFTCPVADLFQ